MEDYENFKEEVKEEILTDKNFKKEVEKKLINELKEDLLEK